MKRRWKKGSVRSGKTFCKRHVDERQGRPIGALDTLIAAHALALNATLMTHNVSEFSRVPGLRVEDWCAGIP